MENLTQEEKELLLTALYEWGRNADPREGNNKQNMIGLATKLGIPEEIEHLTSEMGTDYWDCGHPEIKPYDQLEIGDRVHPSPYAGGYDPGDFIGTVVWKGTHQELLQSDYGGMLEDFTGGDDEIDPSEYDLVIINDDHETMCPGGPTLFNYNNDPPGCVCYFKHQ